MLANHKEINELPTFKRWLLATRPKTLSASVSPILFAYSIVHYFSETTPSVSILLTTMICALLMQIGTNLVNDYFDGVKGIDKEDRLGPIRVVATGLIPARRIQFGYQICFFLAFLIGIYLMSIGGLPIIIIGFASLIFAYAYTGGPLPLSHFALGEILAFIFFGPVAMIGTAILLGYHRLDLVLVFSLAMGFWSSALMSVNNLRDIHTDKNSKKKTIATFFGETFARALTLFLIIAPFITILILIFTLQLTKLHFLSFLSLLPLLKHFKNILNQPISKDLNDTLAAIGKGLTIYSLINSIILIYS